MLSGIWKLALRVLKCFSLMVDLKLFTVHSGSMINSLSPSAPTTDFIGCSSPSSETSSSSAISISSFVKNEEEWTNSSLRLDSLGLCDLTGILSRNLPRHGQLIDYLTHKTLSTRDNKT